jgi:hypothetical protein
MLRLKRRGRREFMEKKIRELEDKLAALGEPHK